MQTQNLLKDEKKHKFVEQQNKSINRKQRQRAKLIISSQIRVLYDPTKDLTKLKKIDKKQIPKTQKPKKQKQPRKSSSINSKYNIQKPAHSNISPIFIQTYQPINPQLQIEYKQYQQSLKEKKQIPGPGSYNISKPLVNGNFQTIQKSQNVLLVKINGTDGTANFKSQQHRFFQFGASQKCKMPGPTDYHIQNKQINQKIKSKLDLYSQSIQSNYKFILEVFNSHYQPNQSIPNYIINDSANGNSYNGKPQKVQSLQFNIKQQNQLGQQKLRNKLLKKAKFFSNTIDLSTKRSISSLSQQIQQKNHNSVFNFITTDLNQLQQKVDKNIPQAVKDSLKLKSTLTNLNLQIQKQIKIKKKIEKLKQNSFIRTFQQKHQQNDQQKIQRNDKQKSQENISYKLSLKHVKKQQLKYKHKQQLYKSIGYFDGSQKQKLSTKYNVKLQTQKLKLKKLLTPIKKYQYRTIDSNQKQIKKQNKIFTRKNQRYSKNMLDVMLGLQTFTNRNVNQSYDISKTYTHNRNQSKSSFDYHDNHLNLPLLRTIGYE